MRSVRLAVIAAAFGLVSSLAMAADAPALSSNDDARKRATSAPPSRARADVSPKAASAALVAPAATPLRVMLQVPSAAEQATLKRSKTTRTAGHPRPPKTQPLAIGFAREVPSAQREIALDSLAWETLADGSRAARIELHSPGAAALRVSLALPAAHPDLSVRFTGNAPRAQVAGPFPANAIAGAVARDGRFFSPVLEGDTATIEIHAVNGAAAVEGLTLTLGPLSHLVAAGATLARLEKRESDIGDSQSCNIDVACVTPPSAALTDAANSVGKLVFSDRAGRTFVCSGTLVNDTVTSGTPYVLSASHCFDDAFLATTINVYWFFRAQACGSVALPSYSLQTGGGFLLARSEDYDWALLRLNRAPPASVYYSAWRAEPVPQLAVGTGLHHPQGDLAKFSQGTSPGYRVFDDGSSFISMQWSQGTTETGSSGSALFTFLASGGYYEARGALFGGDASCADRTGLDFYSRLDNMLPVTRQYLTPDEPVLDNEAVAVEFYNPTLDHYFITIDSNEINLLDTGMLRGWERTGFRFLAHSAPTAGTNPVCRFYLRPEVGDSHFYSADPAECQRVRNDFPTWVYESPSVFYIALPNTATGACPANTRPVWRFFNQRTTNHRYTTEVGLRDRLRFDPSWIAEGYGPEAVIMCAAVGG